MEFAETPSFWYLHVDRLACTNFSTRTVELRPSEHREILHFSFSSFIFFFRFFHFLRTLFFLCFSFFSFIFAFLFFSFFLFSFLLPNEFFLVPISFHFLLIYFSHSFLLIFSFILKISLLLRIAIDQIGLRRKLPPFFLQATCVVFDFPHFSFISLLPFIA